MKGKIEAFRGVLGTFFPAGGGAICEFGDTWQSAAANLVRHSLSWRRPLQPGDRLVIGDQTYDLVEMTCDPGKDDITIPGTGHRPYLLKPALREDDERHKLEKSTGTA